QKAGVFNGDEANRFNPQQKITRAETAKVMVDSLKIKK
ncbi:S-layer homology domain-containing protein, partial [Neglectibacter sp. 59]|nr:S-layer homology domain-containing protein [Neglectibacter sp. 59]